MTSNSNKMLSMIIRHQDTATIPALKWNNKAARSNIMFVSQASRERNNKPSDMTSNNAPIEDREIPNKLRLTIPESASVTSFATKFNPSVFVRNGARYIKPISAETIASGTCGNQVLELS